MKQQATHYLGLDVHQATTVATCRNESGSVVLKATVPTEAKAIVALVRGQGPDVHVAFEEGTQAQWLHDLLQPVAERVIVCNVRGKSALSNKNDDIDSDELSEQLRLGGLKGVYHGASSVLPLKEMVRNYCNLVDDATRVMQRIKAMYRAKAIPTPGAGVYSGRERESWMDKIKGAGSRIRAESLFAQLDALLPLRNKAKAAMLSEARRHGAWKILRSIPQLGPVRASQLIAIVGTPLRFRGKRCFWSYVGLAVVTHSSADNEVVAGRIRRRRRAPRTRGLNRNHNPVLKDVFKGAATAAAHKDGPLKDFYKQSVDRGVAEDLALLTLARKIAAVTLRLWKKGELWDPAKLTTQMT
jgi:transposase